MKVKFLIPTAAAAAAVLMLFSYAKVWGQSNAKSLQDSTVRTSKLGDVVVTSFRVNRKLMEVPASMSIAGAFDYKKNSAFTVANVLNNEPGVSMGGDGAWETNVVVRGLGESRLVTLVDGDRVETATDLTASLSMIDINDIERVEIIKGAQSSLYGSGAVGGIINVITKDGSFTANENSSSANGASSKKPYVHGNLISGYSSVNNYLSDYLNLSTGSKKWYLKFSGSYGKAHDMDTPDGKLKNSQFTTNNISVRAGMKPFANQIFKVQFQRNWTKDAGIPGGAAFAKTAEATYKRIGRTLVDASYEFTNLTSLFKSLKLKYFYQEIQRDVNMQPNMSTTTKMPTGATQVTTPNLITPNAMHRTNGAEIQGVWNLCTNNTLIGGVDFWRRRITSERTKYITVEVFKPNGDLMKTNHLERGETPIPTSSFTSGGIFAQDEMHLLDNKLTITAGGRFDKIWVKNEECYDVNYVRVNDGDKTVPATQRITFEKKNVNDCSWSANIGTMYKITDNTDLVFNAARSFRAPSLEERFRYIDLGSYVRLGNQDLEAENAWSFDLGTRIWGEKYNIQASVFYTRIKNMIADKSGEFIYTETATAKRDTLPALINTNIGKATLYGFDFKGEYNVIDNLVLSASAAYVRGKDTEKDEDLPSIPPFKGSLEATYTFTGIGSAGLNFTFGGRQYKVAENELTTDGYSTLNLYLNTVKFNLSSRLGLQVFAGIENITDTAYRNHLSTARGDIRLEPGRNFFIRASLTF